jgi:hypothetical protein
MDSEISDGAVSGLNADFAINENAKERLMARKYS